MSWARSLLASFGVSVHRKRTIDVLIWELQRLRLGSTEHIAPQISRLLELSESGQPSVEQYRRVLTELARYEAQRPFHITTEDYGALDKQKRIIDARSDFGQCDFAELACGLFASSLSNHRVLHQRIDEGTLLWRVVKMSRGPILEVGRAAGGSTVTILGASGDRRVVSIDRAPIHHPMSEYVFSRPDVQRRLTLYIQSSREPIPESEFGMLFIDGDHSYEGVCHDIASFWNSLRSFDGKPPLAAFHDAADNPIGCVAAVKRACDELLAERGVARVVETWGAMLLVEKLADIDQDRWCAKTDREVWKQYSDSKGARLSPTRISQRLYPDRAPLRTAAANFLRNENVDNPPWIKTGIETRPVFLEADNAVRFVCETPHMAQHRIEYPLKLGVAGMCATIFVRPVRLSTLRLTISGPGHDELAKVDFELTNESRILAPRSAPGLEILNAGFAYQNGFFRCDLSIASPQPVPSMTLAINACNPEAPLQDGSDELRYVGNPDRGFIFNMASVREVL